MFHKRSQTTGSPNIDLHGISLRALQVFSAVVETGSLTEAGTRLGGSRSAVSQQITNLEKAVGAQLIDRSSRPVSLTPVGKVLLRHAHRVLRAVTETQTDLMELSLASPMELRLGVIDDLDASLTPELVGAFQQRYPRCQLTVTSGRSDDLSDALGHRKLDLVLTGMAASPSTEFAEIPILREPFMLVAPRGVFNLSGDIRQQMHERTFVRYNASMPIGMMIAQHLRRLRIELPAPYSFDATRSVFAMMIKSRGWTITTPLCVLDASRDLELMDCLRLPFGGFERIIRVASWRDELGSLPGYFADMVRTLIQQQLLAQVRQLAGWLEQEFEILD
jgi:DNA-binding transcriptional LysR family regulator